MWLHAPGEGLVSPMRALARRLVERFGTPALTPWPEVHRMFYEGLLVGGTPVARAQLMYAAVWLGGPRWTVKPSRQFTSQRVLPAEAPVIAPALVPAAAPIVVIAAPKTLGVLRQHYGRATAARRRAAG